MAASQELTSGKRQGSFCKSRIRSCASLRPKSPRFFMTWMLIGVWISWDRAQVDLESSEQSEARAKKRQEDGPILCPQMSLNVALDISEFKSRNNGFNLVVAVLHPSKLEVGIAIFFGGE